jgi:hypothetical protein
MFEKFPREISSLSSLIFLNKTNDTQIISFKESIDDKNDNKFGVPCVIRNYQLSSIKE